MMKVRYHSKICSICFKYLSARKSYIVPKKEQQHFVIDLGTGSLCDCNILVSNSVL